MDANLAAESLGGQDNPKEEVIKNVQATNAWTAFRDDFAIAMYTEY